MNRSRPVVFHWKAVLAAAVSACVVAGCGDSGPTQPEPISLSELFGTQLFKADGTSVGLAGMQGTSIIGIYFASPGCPACEAFNPTLVDAYSQWKSEGKSVEVVLVTTGVSLASLLGYMTDADMPWRAVSPEGGKANYLIQRYNIRWVPTLVVLNGGLDTISLTGRDDLAQAGPAAYDLWLAAGGGAPG